MKFSGRGRVGVESPSTEPAGVGWAEREASWMSVNAATALATTCHCKPATVSRQIFAQNMPSREARDLP